jgi:hypothetical protein
MTRRGTACCAPTNGVGIGANSEKRCGMIRQRRPDDLPEAEGVRNDAEKGGDDMPHAWIPPCAGICRLWIPVCTGMTRGGGGKDIGRSGDDTGRGGMSPIIWMSAFCGGCLIGDILVCSSW